MAPAPAGGEMCQYARTLLRGGMWLYAAEQMVGGDADGRETGKKGLVRLFLTISAVSSAGKSA